MRSIKDRIHQPKNILVAPGVYDVLSARVAETAGFEAIALGGFAMVASMLGKPDMGLHSLFELVVMVKNITEEVDIPLLVDGDTGYGNPLNVIRTVREIESAGAAGIFLEDQITPPNMTGRPLIPAPAMVNKLKAALDARRNEKFLIIARTDAAVQYGYEEAIARGKAYEEAGSDAILITRPSSLDELKGIVSAIQIPKVILMIEGTPPPFMLGKIKPTPFLTVQELNEMGFSVVWHPISAILAAVAAIKDVFQELKIKGTTSGVTGKMLPHEEVNKILKENKWREYEKKYKAGSS